MLFSLNEIINHVPSAIKPGQMLWEAKHNRKQFEAIKKGDPYTAASQYQQDPQILGGGLFKDSYWQHYEVLPPDIERMIMTVDTAQKTNEWNDYTVLQVWARARKGIYLIDQLRGKFEAPQLERNLIDFWNKHKPTLHKPMGVTCVYIEDKSSGSSLIQSIKQETLIPIEALQRNVDKVLRSMGAVKYFASGFVHLPVDKPWIHDYKDEFRAFSPLMTHPHDDQVDATLDAVEQLIVFSSSIYNINSIGEVK